MFSDNFLFCFVLKKKVNYKLVSSQEVLYCIDNSECSAIYPFISLTYLLLQLQCLPTLDVKHETSTSSEVMISFEKRSSSADNNLGTLDGVSVTMDQPSEDDLKATFCDSVVLWSDCLKQATKG